ncbi:MAG: hypothetical protein AB7T10_00885 [bacterium]
MLYDQTIGQTRAGETLNGVLKKNFLFFLLALAMLSSCGKKLPPPSPDIFPAKVLLGYYIPNSQIRVDFNENLYSSFDSAYCQINEERFPVNGYVKSKSVFINYDFDSSAEYLDLFGVQDEKKNKRDYLSIKIGGKVQKDTMPPEIIKQVLSDSTLLLEFSEDIFSCSLELLPEYVSYSYSVVKNKVIAKYFDTLGFYPLQMFVSKAEDSRKNNIKAPIEHRFVDFSDSASFVSLRIDSVGEFKTLILIDADSSIIFKKNSGLSQYVLFDNLKQGRYEVCGDSFFLDTLLLK